MRSMCPSKLAALCAPGVIALLTGACMQGHATEDSPTAVESGAHAAPARSGTGRSLPGPQLAPAGATPMLAKSQPPSAVPPVSVPAASVPAVPKPGRPAKPPDAIPTVAEPVSARLVFTQSPCTASVAQVDAEFSITGVRELFVCTIWSGLAGEHTELMRFRAPDGEIYYQKLIAFSTTATAPMPFTRPVDVPHDEVVRALEVEANGELVVGDYIALAGAWIGDHGMIGPWQLEVFLDGAKVPSVSSSFELVP
jgi:hypothetical protein